MRQIDRGLLCGCLFLASCSTAPTSSYSEMNIADLERSVPRIPSPEIACAQRSIVKLPETTPGGETHSEGPGEVQSILPIVVRADTDDDSAGALMARAWEKSKEGNRDATVALFERAFLRADNHAPLDRLHWSYGWAMFNLHEHGCALAHFAAARVAAPERSGWAPHTFAVTYWQLGQRDLAVRWYDIAARNTPACWGSVKSAAACSKYWRQQERRALGELLTMWKAWRLGVPAAN